MINVICLYTKCKQENMAGQGIQNLLVSIQGCKGSTWGLFLTGQRLDQMILQVPSNLVFYDSMKMSRKVQL